MCSNNNVGADLQLSARLFELILNSVTFVGKRLDGRASAHAIFFAARTDAGMWNHNADSIACLYVVVCAYMVIHAQGTSSDTKRRIQM